MKIVTWNIETAKNKLTDKVVDYVDNLSGDIVCLQEIKDETTDSGKTLWNRNTMYGTSVGDIWTESKTKRHDNYKCGLGIISKYNVELLIKDNSYENFPFVVLYKVTNNNDKPFYLFNIWLKQFNGRDTKSYVNRLSDAINYYSNVFNFILKNDPIILIGDFNISPSNMVEWKNLYSRLNNDYKLESAYHCKRGVLFGEEKEYTFGNNFHCDLCLYSKLFFKCNSVNIDETIIKNKISDHNPLIVELEYL